MVYEDHLGRIVEGGEAYGPVVEAPAEPSGPVVEVEEPSVPVLEIEELSVVESEDLPAHVLNSDDLPVMVSVEICDQDLSAITPEAFPCMASTNEALQVSPPSLSVKPVPLPRMTKTLKRKQQPTKLSPRKTRSKKN